MKACCQCGEILGYNHFLIWRKNASMTKNYYSKNCKPCIRQEQRKLQAIKKLFPPPKAGTPCACCGKVDRLVVDHGWSIDDPKTSFRGYICRSCNVGMGHLGDSLAGVQKAVDYLERPRLEALVLDFLTHSQWTPRTAFWPNGVGTSSEDLSESKTKNGRSS